MLIPTNTKNYEKYISFHRNDSLSFSALIAVSFLHVSKSLGATGGVKSAGCDCSIRPHTLKGSFTDIPGSMPRQDTW